MRKVWEKRALLGPRNISLWREPWGFYLRTKWWRFTAGPLFGWKVQRCWMVPSPIRHPRRTVAVYWGAFKERKQVTFYERGYEDGSVVRCKRDRDVARDGHWWELGYPYITGSRSRFPSKKDLKFMAAAGEARRHDYFEKKRSENLS